MQIRFLCIERDSVYLLGYPLKLSPTEDKLLRIIADGGRRGSEDLLRLLPDGVSKGNIAVHINAINRKAEKISHRKLVIRENGQYTINPFM